jgi:NAD-dependent SIR2 family protein deacetylase
MFVVTSNVDGHFERAGWNLNKIVEIHGDLRTVQCKNLCTRDVYPMPQFASELVDESELPRCPDCGDLQRPQVMMFNDPAFNYCTVDTQLARYREWESAKSNILGIEIGAGTGIPSIRIFGNERTATLIRINPYEPDISRPQDIAIPATAIEGIDLVLEVCQNH